MKCRKLANLLAGVVLAWSGAASATYSQLYVFGDSLSDNGNMWLATGGAIPDSPPYAQKFSNGPVAVERLAARLGLSLTPSLAGGNDYAFAGAATGNVGAYDNYVSYAYGIPILNGWTGIDKQVAGFAAAPPVGLSSALVVMWGGPNDLFIDPSTTAASDAANNLAGSIASLINAGARHILVPSMVDLSSTAEGQAATQFEQAGLSALSAFFNAELDARLDSLRLANPQVQLFGFDTNAAISSLIDQKAVLGFTNTTGSCVESGCFLTPGLADQYLFWDGVHPSAHANQILGDMLFAQVVPEPEVYMQLLAGLLITGIALARRRGGDSEAA